VFDLDAYLERVGLRGRADMDLAELHLAHVFAIPFENLDPRRGVPVSLALEDLSRKLVAENRGGYCFEHNLLLKAALEALGAQVEPMLARVRLGVAPGHVRPRTHLVLRVQWRGASWHADAGFGRGTLLAPIPFGTGGPYEQSGWCFRVVQDGPELVLQDRREDEWTDLYGFIPEPVPFIDVETSNWYAATHPRSPFVTGLIVSAQRADGGRVSLDDWNGELALTEETPEHRTVTAIEPDAAREMIPALFGLEAVGV
jgi:N-hydroxyarylamine O-acetyltransferase